MLGLGDVCERRSIACRRAYSTDSVGVIISDNDGPISL